MKTRQSWAPYRGTPLSPLRAQQVIPTTPPDRRQRAAGASTLEEVFARSTKRVNARLANHETHVRTRLMTTCESASVTVESHGHGQGGISAGYKEAGVPMRNLTGW
jgi:hypothetical protein